MSFVLVFLAAMWALACLATAAAGGFFRRTTLPPTRHERPTRLPDLDS